MMKKAKIFKNGQSQAVRLPKEFRFDEKEVCVQKCGDGVLLLPVGKFLNSFKESLDQFSSDFMDQRDQPKNQTREEF